jgi:ribosomal protein S3
MMKGKLILLFASLLMLTAFVSTYGLGDDSSTGATSGSQDQTTGSDQGTMDSSDQSTTGSDQSATESDQSTTGSQEQGTTEDRDQGTKEYGDDDINDDQRDGSTELKEDGDSQFQDSDIDNDANKLSMSDQSKSSSLGKDAGTMGKDQGMTDVQQSLRKAGVSETKIQQWQAFFNTPFYTNSPAFVLGLKDSINLTSDQQQRLTKLNDQTRSQAQQILTKEQQDKLSKLPTQQFTLHDLHVEACQKVMKMAKNRQSSAQDQSCPITCPLCPSQSQDTGSSAGSSSAQQDVSGSSGSSSGIQHQSAAGSMSKDQGTAEIQQKLRSAGVSDDKIQLWQGLMNAPIYTNSPAFLLGMKDTLNLTSDQQQRLTSLNDQTRTQVQQILTKEQQDKLAKIPTQQFTLRDLHNHVCQKIQSRQQSAAQGKTCPSMNCPLCPSQSQSGTNTGQQKDGSTDVQGPTTQPYQQQ